MKIVVFVVLHHQDESYAHCEQGMICEEEREAGTRGKARNPPDPQRILAELRNERGAKGPGLQK